MAALSSGFEKQFSSMNPTQEMIGGINEILALVREEPLRFPPETWAAPELELLQAAKEQYTGRLLRKVPKYAKLPPDQIPEMFLQGLLKREAVLRKGSA